MKRVVAAPASFLKNRTFFNSRFILSLFTIMAISTLATVNIAFADDISGNGSSEVNAVVKESISVGIDHNGLAFSITPTAVGAFASKSTNIHVYTNAKGYKLYISSKISETSLKHIDSTVTKPIKTLGVLKGSVDSGTGLPVPAIDKDAFTVNSWGYSLDGTNFYGVSYDTPSLLKETDNFTDIGDSITPITFGASADTNMPAGTYQNTVVITATATIVPPNKPAMPSNSGWVTSATISPEATGGVHTVKTYEFYVTQDVDFTPTAGTAANKPSGMELEISKDTGYVDGIYYVFSRAIDQADSRSDWSDQITVKLDATKPTTTLASTSTQKANQQTATITCADNKEVASYYFGTKAENELTDIDFTIVSATTNASGSTWSGTETISAAGTYNLFCKDVAGGISDSDSIAYYNYNAVTLLDTIAGTAGNYISANYEATTTGPTYLAMAGMEVNPTTLYTIPTPASKLENYKGASTTLDSTNAATLTNNSIAINNPNMVIYAWFDRNVYTLTLERDPGFNNVSGDGTYKHGKEASISAELIDGFNWNNWEVISGNTPTDINSKDTTVTITQNTTLKAKNGDSQKPIVSLQREDHDTFKFTITDNTAVTHYCITNNDTKPSASDSCWTAANSETSYTNTKTVDSINSWYVWGKDNRDNISDVNSNSHIDSYQVIRDVEGATLTTKWDSASGTSFTYTTSYALDGTSVYYSAAANNANENYVFRKNGVLSYDTMTSPTASANTISVKDEMDSDNKLTLYLHGTNPTTPASNLGSALFMQQVTGSTCNNTTASGTTEYKLVDARDGKSYLVKKLGSHCWMTQNLALEGGITLTSNLSNVTTPYPLPASNNTTSGWESSGYQTREQMYYDSHINETPDNANSGEGQNRGAYYTFQVATAGTGSSITASHYNTTNDICPKGWHLPAFNDADGSATIGGEFGNLTALTAWASWTHNLNSGYFSDFGNAFTSYCRTTGCPNSDGLGLSSNWWSSTVTGADFIRDLYAESVRGLYTGSANRGSGYSIRCVAIMDSEAPSKPTLNRTTYNTFTISSSDNTGVTGYYVSVDDATAPNGSSSWTYVTSTENLSAPYTIDTSSAHVYRVWTRDAAGNISAVSDPIVSRLVTHTQGANTTLTVYHDAIVGTDGTPSCISNISGTPLSTLSHTGSGSFVVLSGTPVCTSATANTDGYAPSTFTWNETDILKSRGGYGANIAATTAIVTGDATKLTLAAAIYLQDVTTSSCSQTVANNNTVYSLKDRRDDKIYLVKKLSDGHCWMNQNLAIGSNSSQMQLNTTYSNINYTLPQSSKNGFSNNAIAYLYVDDITGHKDSQPDDKDVNTGGYYSWCAATAGACTNVTSAYNNVSNTQNICPQNWKLPTLYNDSQNSTGELMNIFKNTSTFAGPWGISLVGRYWQNKLQESGERVDYWSSTSANSNSARYINSRSDNNVGNFHNDNNTDRAMGSSIRCVIF